MKEIKFRAWDNTKNDWRWGIEGSLKQIMAFGISDEYENWDVMQYTGIKDEKGKEIYEGDIIKWIHAEGAKCETRGVGIVKWCSSETCFCENTDGLNGFGIGMLSCEVIGNIYENPELINQ